MAEDHGDLGGEEQVEYVGVIRSTDADGADTFAAQLRWQGTRYNLGEFATALEAAKAYDWAARLIDGGKRLNFALEHDLGEPPRNEHAARLVARKAQKGSSGAAPGQGKFAQVRRYIGVVPNKNSPANPFKAQLHWRGEQYHLGSFSTALAAAKAYDWGARLVGEGTPLNFVPYAELGWPPSSIAVDQLRAKLATVRGSQPLRAPRER